MSVVHPASSDSSEHLFSAIRSVWALLVGVALIMIANGLQTTLLSLRATSEGFSTQTIGIVMSGYFAGLVVGSFVSPTLIKRVGHIRVFAAMASLASITILIHILFIDPLTWIAVRVISGLCFSGVYIVTESWLNERASNRSRGQLLSVYTLVTFAAMTGGQLSLNLGDPNGYELFLFSSVIISIGLVPLLLTARPAPAFESGSRMAVSALFKASPLGVVGALLTGVSHGAIFGMGPVYGQKVGMDTAQISYFMAIIVFGGVVSQWPIGRLSDAFDRRMVLTLVTLGAGACAAFAMFTANKNDAVFLLACGLLGGMALTMYALCIAYTADYLTPEQLVSASATMVLASGIGLTCGPLLAALFMTLLGDAGYFIAIALVHVVIGIYALYRMTRREALPADEQTPFVPISVQETTINVVKSSEEAQLQSEQQAEQQQ